MARSIAYNQTDSDSDYSPLLTGADRLRLAGKYYAAIQLYEEAYFAQNICVKTDKKDRY